MFKMAGEGRKRGKKRVRGENWVSEEFKEGKTVKSVKEKERSSIRMAGEGRKRGKEGY